MTKKALVVDDDPLVRNLIATLLRRKGMLAIQAANGEEAIALLTQAQQALDADEFDLILLDLMMARTNGWDVLRHIEREIPRLLPHVVIVSASGEMGMRDAERIGCGAVLPKPFDSEELYRIVSKCIRGPHELDPNTPLPVLALLCSLALTAMELSIRLP